MVATVFWGSIAGTVFWGSIAGTVFLIQAIAGRAVGDQVAF